MRVYGKVLEYNGYSGYIISSDGIKCLFVKDDIIGADISNGDVVSFERDKYEDIELSKYLAKFIKKVNVG